MKKANLTEAMIEKLKPAEFGKRYSISDTKLPGFTVRVTDKGTKTYQVYKKIAGRPVRVTIGKANEISLKDAKGQAYDILSQIQKGINPNVAKHNIDDNTLLKDMFALYMELHAKKHTKEQTWKDNEGIYQRSFIKFRNRRIADISKQDIISMHNKIKNDKGLYAANHALTLIRHVFNKAIEWGWDGKNPAFGIPKFKEKSRDRYLKGEELPIFFQALANEPNEDIRDYVYLSLFTGARKSNILAMEWSHISFQSKEWYIPETKNGEPQTVLLSEKAIEVLETRKAKASGKERWVFPSDKSSAGHRTEPKRAWKKLLEKAGIKDFRLHDLRRTLGSYQAITGASSFIIGKSLNHKSTQSTAIYARLSADPVRASIEKATAAMFELSKNK